MKIDLHLHSQYSWDSKVPIIEFIRKAEEKGFGAIAITDHNNTESHEEIKKLQSQTKVILIPGQEVSTSDGHLLVYGWLPTITSGLSMKESVEKAHSFGTSMVLCIAAHPFDKLRKGKGKLVFETGVVGIEVLNASTLIGYFNKKAKKSLPKSLAGVGNSDSHRLEEFGTAYTEIALSHSIDEVLRNIVNGLAKGKRIGVWKKSIRFFRRKLGLMKQ